MTFDVDKSHEASVYIFFKTKLVYKKKLDAREHTYMAYNCGMNIEDLT